MRTRGLRVMLYVCILAAWAIPAHAQAIGSIFGKVTDPSGAVLPGVTVTVTGTGLQQPLVAVTSENGTYQFPSVPLGTYSVTFELTNFKKAVRPNVVITSGFNAGVDQKLELGQMTEEVTISAASPVVDTKRTATGATFTAEVLEKIPTARDPWQIINMTPGVQAGLNVGGSASGQQVSLAARGTGANVQWNLEGGSITDLSSNSSPSYFNFDSFDQIQVTTGGGDVSVQSSGLSINLVTKSGSNVFKGSATGTFANSNMQAQNVSQAQFNAGQNGFLSGNPVKRIDVLSAEYGGPILKNKLWFWAGGDNQDINVGIVNFFDGSLGQFCQQLVAAQKQGSQALKNLVTYDKIGQVNDCLANDKTVIKDLQWKLNYQLNSHNKFQWLYQSDNKYRNHRGSSATTALEATTQQTSDKVLGMPLPTHSLTHTLIVSDKLVFNNQYTYVKGGFFLDYQDVPPQGNCLQSRYTGSDQLTGYAQAADCQFNLQALNNRTTALSSRSLIASYQTQRPSHELKTDGTYFLTHKLGGDHSLKFGLGWRKNPILTFSHYSGGARALVECPGNNINNCGDGTFQPAGSATGLVAYEAILYRDFLINNDWWTYNGYLQDSYSRGRIRLNGGLRYDWQQSKYLGGCVTPNVILPASMPSQCESATQVDSTNGHKIQAFSNWSPRISATYDVFGTGKTQIHGNYSYFYDTKITLANALAGLSTATRLTYGPNTSSGACTGSSCWQDLNHDGLVQANELSGNPSSSTNRFQNGVVLPSGNIVDPSAQIGRTREAVIGAQHELIANLAVGVDFIYRKYDRGTATYPIGYQPGGPAGSIASFYVPATWTDPTTGLSATYYQICSGCARPAQGVSNIAVTNVNYRTYTGVDLTATKRYSNRWQAAVAVTIQDNPSFFPVNSPTFQNPTGIDYQNGLSTISKYVTKVQGSYTFKWDIAASVNFNWNQGATRSVYITGPGQVFGGINADGTTNTISYNAAGSSFPNTILVQPINKTRFGDTRLLDAGVQKTFRLRGGKERIKLMFDGFNLTNSNTIQSYVSPNLSDALNFAAPSAIVPPRIFRVGATLNF